MSIRVQERRQQTYLSQACAIRDWALDPTLMTFIGRIPGMVPVCVGGVVIVPVLCYVLVECWLGRSILGGHEISGVQVGDTEGVVHAKGIGSKK